jgi:hypothetical protein
MRTPHWEEVALFLILAAECCFGLYITYCGIVDKSLFFCLLGPAVLYMMYDNYLIDKQDKESQ